MLRNKYSLLFKTGDAELRALENFYASKENIFPIIELTRGRKSKSDDIGRIEKRIDKIKDIFGDLDVCIDITTSTSLTNLQLDNLYNSYNGYDSWINFLISLNDENIFKSITPTILVNVEDSDFEKNLLLQTKSICSNFKSISYRNSITDDGCYQDVELLKGVIEKKKTNFIFIIDCEYIYPGAWLSYANKVIVRIEKIKKILPNAKFIIISTSFPKFVSDLGDDPTATFHFNEIEIFDKVQSQLKKTELFYGDYGSINPVRNDQIIMSRGWIPRIDVPLQKDVFYYKQKRGNREYSEVYTEIARDYVIPDKRFPSKLKNNWGIEQINTCADGYNPGSSPSFWISVRMNIHVHQQLRRLGFI